MFRRHHSCRNPRPLTVVHCPAVLLGAEQEKMIQQVFVMQLAQPEADPYTALATAGNSYSGPAQAMSQWME